jgi:hypothetical protein
MLPKWGAFLEGNRQEVQHPFHPNDLQDKKSAALPGRHADEVQPSTVTKSRIPRPLPPTPVTHTSLEVNNNACSIDKLQISACPTPVPPPSTFRPPSRISNNVRDLRSQKQEIQEQPECEGGVSRQIFEKVPPPSPRPFRPLPLPPTAAATEVYGSCRFEEHLTDAELRHDGASSTLSPIWPVTPTPLSPPNPFDVPHHGKYMNVTSSCMFKLALRYKLPLLTYHYSRSRFRITRRWFPQASTRSC